MRKLILASFVALSAAGAAHAQQSVLDDPTTMSPFYTDNSLSTLRSQSEFEAAVGQLQSSDRERIRSECANTNTQRSNFCDMFMSYGNQ